MDRCDIAIISYNQLSYTRGCIESIAKNTRCPHRVIVVDNASDAETRAYLDSLAGRKEIVLLQNQANEGWVKAVNRAIEFSDTEYLCVMNNDTVVYPGWLEEMVAAAQKDGRAGLVNPEWQVPEGFPGGREWYYRLVIRRRKGRSIATDWARGFCFLISRKLIKRIGGLDLEFSPAYYDDWDYSVRALKNGFTVLRAQGAFVRHYLNVTYGETLRKDEIDTMMGRKAMLFHQRWGYPLRLLFAGKQPWDTASFGALLTNLLNDQHRIVLAGTGPSGISHTNLSEIEVPRPLAAICARLQIEGRSRKHEPDFDLVVCGAGMKQALSRGAGSRLRYFVAAAAYSSHDLMRTVSRLKHEQKGKLK